MYSIEQMLKDKYLLQEDVSIEGLQKTRQDQNVSEATRRRASILCNLTAVLKRMRNERIIVEELLSNAGMGEMSQALYCLDWRQRYYESEERWMRWRNMPVYKRIWRAIRNNP